MSTPEAKVKAKVKKVLGEFEAYYAMPMGTGFGRAGIPDFLICHKGYFVGVECKANRGKPTALQEFEMAMIRKAGGVTLVINEDNLELLREVLKEISDGE